MKPSTLPLLVLITTGIVVIVPSTATASHKGCVQLWMYTEPVQKGPCVIFHHPVGKALAAANNANIRFNAGIEAGQKAEQGAKCPSLYKNKDFCQGWTFANHGFTGGS